MQATSSPPAKLHFSDHAHWLEIGNALSGPPLTMAECARQLGLDVSVIYRPIHEMKKAELLECDREKTKGAKYNLRPDLIETFREEISRNQRCGELKEGQVVFSIHAEQLAGLAQVFLDAELASCLLWAAELDGGDRCLFVLDTQRSSSVARNRLRAALEANGVSCQTSRVAELHDRQSWLRAMAATRDAAAG